MKSYRMPVSLNEEDKVFGGILSARQFLILTGSLVVGGAITMMLPSGLGAAVLKVAGVLLPGGLGAVFAFARVGPGQMRPDQYLVLRLVSRQTPRDYPWRGYRPPGRDREVPGLGFWLWFLAAAGVKKDGAGRPGFPRRGGHSRRDD